MNHLKIDNEVSTSRKHSGRNIAARVHVPMVSTAGSGGWCVMSARACFVFTPVQHTHHTPALLYLALLCPHLLSPALCSALLCHAMLRSHILRSTLLWHAIVCYML